MTSVDVTRPPRTTSAIGWAISWPAIVPVTTSGRIATAVTIAGTIVAARRSLDPRTTRPRPGASPSRSSAW